MTRAALAAVVVLYAMACGAAVPPLAGWSCHDVGTLYGNIAVERDAGRSLRETVAWVSDAVKRSLETESPANLDIEAEDVRAIIAAVYHVYAATELTPAQHRRLAMERCFGGRRWPPENVPQGVRKGVPL